MRRDDKNRTGLTIGNVDHAQKPTRARLPDSDPRAFSTRSIFNGTTKDILDLVLVDRMVVDVGLVSDGVNVVESAHPWMLPRIGCLQSFSPVTSSLFRDAQRSARKLRRPPSRFRRGCHGTWYVRDVDSSRWA